MLALVAFCGLFVAGGDPPAGSDATQVVVMRLGARTVLTIEPSYRGPAEPIALVVPVPGEVRDGDVKIVPREVVAHVDQLSAPRLVESWEQDPCAPPPPPAPVKPDPAIELEPAQDAGKAVPHFAAGAYDLAIVPAKDAGTLEGYLRAGHLALPAGAEALLRTYADAGATLVVARLDPARLDGAALPALRIAYDADRLVLPLRLDRGPQDLTVFVLAPHQRYQAASVDNVTIPTNLDVRAVVAGQLGAFYVALYDATVARHPAAVVTEYAWPATSCDPCTGPPLEAGELQTLGADVLGGTRDHPQSYPAADDFVLTRLHVRYAPGRAGDLALVPAEPIVGGREQLDAAGQLERGARGDSINSFQARYAIRHAWDGPERCERPRRGVWGGPPAELGVTAKPVVAALDLAHAPRGAVELATVLVHPDASPPPAPPIHAAAWSTSPQSSGCGCRSSDPGGLALALVVLALACRPGARRARVTPRGAHEQGCHRGGRAARRDGRGARVLRVLRQRVGQQAVQRRDPGRADARRHAHGAVDAERLSGAARGLRDGRAGAGRAARARRQDPAQGGVRARRVARLAAPGRVLGAGSVSAADAEPPPGEGRVRARRGVDARRRPRRGGQG
ncbi:MAG TPA: DUF2330 domain-containing protein, partial [Kofleriaceae bacterium]|nr:DUF2330 domain-containing protein [Kofleriaceae bacterium]